VKILNKVSAGLLLFAIILIVAPTGASAAWKQNNVGWWYTEGNSYALGWRNIGGTWYYFNSNGYMKTGWANINGDYYYFDTAGAMAHDSKINNFTIGPDGKWISSSQLELERKIADRDTINKLTSQPIIITSVENNNSNNNSNTTQDSDGYISK
jgi:hypothetical protein